MENDIEFKYGKYGLSAIIRSIWKPKYISLLIEKKITELELNMGKGWRGENVEFLLNLPWLESLIIHDFTIKTVQPIHQLQLLKNLELHTYCNHHIAFDAFPQLIECGFEWRPKSESLFNCVNLRRLFINKYNEESSQRFVGLQNLEKLTIMNSKLKELNGLSFMSQLRTLRLANLSGLTSIKGIEDLMSLNTLDLEKCKNINSISNIKNLKNLKRLMLIDMQKIDGFEVLKCLEKVEEVLFYGDTNILDGDLSILRNLKYLTKVSFQNRRHYSLKREDFGKAYFQE